MKSRKWLKLTLVLLVASILLIAATPALQARYNLIYVKKLVITGSGGLVLGDAGGGLDMNGKKLTLDADADSSITCDTDDQCDWELGGQDEYILTAAVLDLGEGTLTRIDLDADGDTSLRSSAEDQIDIELGGSDQFVLKIPPAPVGGNQTTRLFELAATTPIYTDGTNIITGLNIDLVIGNATAGTNAVDAIGIDAISGDAQVTETGLSVGTGFDLAIDVQGQQIDLDVDNDTSITADTDNQIDVELGGQDEYVLTAAVLDLGEGTLTRIDLDADGDTSLRSSADDQIDIELGGSDIFTMTATNFYFNGKVLTLDVDIDTSITASIDDQIDFELGGSDVYSMTATNIYVNAKILDLDADQDTSITASTDDQIDIEISGADDFIFTANKFESQTGSVIDLNGTQLILDADGDTEITTSFDDIPTLTIGAAGGRLDILVGNLKIGDGTNDITLDGEDFYVEGTVEVDGAVDIADNLTIADELIVGRQTVISPTTGGVITPTGRYQPLSSAGTVTVTIETTGFTTGTEVIFDNTTATTIRILNTGTAKLAGDIDLDQYDTLFVKFDGTNWIEVSRSNNTPTAGLLVSQATYAIEAEGNNLITVTVQLQDVDGDDMTVPSSLNFYLADDAAGLTIASAPDTSLAIVTDGSLIEWTANASGLAISEVDGDIDLALGDSGSGTWYLVFVMPDGSLSISGAITFS